MLPKLIAAIAFVIVLIALSAISFLNNGVQKRADVQSGFAQQAAPRVIHRLPVEADEPLAITEVKASGQSVTPDQVFTANDDWLKTLTVSVKNNSDKGHRPRTIAACQSRLIN